MGMGMIGFWTKHWWWLALPILLGAIAFAYVSPTLNHDFFCAGENSCFREWISALVGWAALLVAAPTLFYLARQLREMERFNRVSAHLQLEPTFNAAHHVWKLTMTLEDTIAEYGTNPRRLMSLDWQERALSVQALANILIAGLEREEMAKASAIYGTYITGTSVVQLLQTVLRDIEDNPPNDARHMDEKWDILIFPVMRTTQQFLTEVRKGADGKLKFSTELMKLSGITDGRQRQH